MSAHAHDEAHGANVKRIWFVFGLLSVVTTVEVFLGIYKPESLYFKHFLGMNLLNWIFYILTIFKAYYIIWAFMHMEGERANLRWSVVATVIFLVMYLLFILLVEAHYIFGVFRDSTIKWNF